MNGLDKTLGQAVNVDAVVMADCPYCHGDKDTAEIAMQMGFRPDVSFVRIRKLERGIMEAKMHLATNYDADGNSMVESDAWRELENCLKA